MLAKLRTTKTTMWSLVGILLLVAMWSFMSMVLPPIVAPSLWSIALALRDYLGDADVHLALGYSLWTLLSALATSIVLGAAIAAVMTLSRRARVAVYPTVALLNAVPGISWLGLAVIWFGNGSGPTRFLVVVSAMPILITSLVQAYSDRDPRLQELAHVHRLSAGLKFRKVTFPQLVGPARSAIAAMIGLAWKLTIMGEYLSSSAGMGRLLFNAKSNLQTERVIALTLIIIAVWAALDVFFRAISQRILPVNLHGYELVELEKR